MKAHRREFLFRSGALSFRDRYTDRRLTTLQERKLCIDERQLWLIYKKMTDLNGTGTRV
ncbi:hypothetical protein [Paraburkholderia sp. BL6665CI2N2]|uniref:hypothetical protein n=1 Tax=Paraburkholderia sp. BL6665CI2N2 TaxID=1938806 RepID=UPI001416F595|nr:hypothetical protein [Paraburkholderia sp. BL6665CI2N2]